MDSAFHPFSMPLANTALPQPQVNQFGLVHSLYFLILILVLTLLCDAGRFHGHHEDAAALPPSRHKHHPGARGAAAAAA